MTALSNWDWFFTAILAVSAGLGLWRGLVRELFSLVSWVAALVLAQYFAPSVAPHLPMAGATPPLPYVAAFVLVFAVVLLLGTVLGWLVQSLLKTVGLGTFDRLLGAGFGVLRGGVLVMVLVWLVSMTSYKNNPVWQASQGVAHAQKAWQMVGPWLPQALGKYLP